jgi:hypothetical protein
MLLDQQGLGSFKIERVEIREQSGNHARCMT